MLSVLLLAATALANDPAAVAEGGYELISAKRDVSVLETEVAAILPQLGACNEHTGGLNYGKLTLSFMVDKRGKTANHSVRSEYVIPKDLTECLTEPLAELELGRGDVSVAKVTVTLP